MAEKKPKVHVVLTDESEGEATTFVSKFRAFSFAVKLSANEYDILQFRNGRFRTKNKYHIDALQSSSVMNTDVLIYRAPDAVVKNPLECSLCGVTFKDSGLLAEHLKGFHSI